MADKPKPRLTRIKPKDTWGDLAMAGHSLHASLLLTEPAFVLRQSPRAWRLAQLAC